MPSETKWTDDPEPTSSQPKLPIARCGVGAMTPFIVLSDRHIGGDLHYYSRRSIPCQLHDCPYCAAHSRSVWKGYLHCWDAKHRECGMLEFTLPCLQNVNSYLTAHGTLRTAVVQLTRKGSKINGPLTIQLTPSTWATNEIPPTVNLRPILEHMWDAKPETKATPQRPQNLIAPENAAETNRPLPVPSRFTDVSLELETKNPTKEVIENWIRNSQNPKRNGHPSNEEEART